MNGPALAVRGGVVAVAWYTGAEDRNRVLLATSSDGGATFTAPRVVAAGPHVQGRPGVAFVGQQIAVTFVGAGDGGGLGMRRFRIKDGAPLAEQPENILRLGEGPKLPRSAGFPQILAVDSGLLIAWTTPDGIRTARVEWPQTP